MDIFNETKRLAFNRTSSLKNISFLNRAIINPSPSTHYKNDGDCEQNHTIKKDRLLNRSCHATTTTSVPTDFLETVNSIDDNKNEFSNNSISESISERATSSGKSRTDQQLAFESASKKFEKLILQQETEYKKRKKKLQKKQKEFEKYRETELIHLEEEKERIKRDHSDMLDAIDRDRSSMLAEIERIRDEAFQHKEEMRERVILYVGEKQFVTTANTLRKAMGKKFNPLLSGTIHPDDMDKERDAIVLDFKHRDGDAFQILLDWARYGLENPILSRMKKTAPEIVEAEARYFGIESFSLINGVEK